MFDLHCHMLPGLDDGAANLKESLEMARIAVADGIRAVVCTPHWCPPHFENTRTQIIAATEQFRKDLAANQIALEIYPCAELRLDGVLSQGIASGHLMTFNDMGRFALIEFPEVILPQGLKDFVWELQSQGITPIIGHPERNHGFLTDPLRLYELVAMGALTQLTGSSLLGRFGRETQNFCSLLLKHNMAHILASDAHGPRARTPRLARACRVVKEIVGEKAARHMVHDTPKRILAGQTVSVPEPIMPRRNSPPSRLFFWRRQAV